MKRKQNKNKARAKRSYKDTVFRKLFSGKKELLSLYNAINGTHYTDTGLLQIVTLENAIYMYVKNDLAFIIGEELHLYEHQSTDNPNIPLRMLEYVETELKRLFHKRSLYSTRLQKIPTPKFFMFYNGMEERPSRWEYRLSKAFEVPVESPDLELVVHVYNINDGKNRKLMEQCRTLHEYSQYVASVRKYAKAMPLTEAVDRAIEECIREGILEDFLSENRAEVESMSIFEFDEEREMRLIRRDEREIGKEIGKKLGEKIGKKLGEEIGQERVNILFKKLRVDGRVEDWLRSVDDKEFQNQLLKEYNL